MRKSRPVDVDVRGVEARLDWELLITVGVADSHEECWPTGQLRRSKRGYARAWSSPIAWLSGNLCR